MCRGEAASTQADRPPDGQAAPPAQNGGAGGAGGQAANPTLTAPPGPSKAAAGACSAVEVQSAPPPAAPPPAAPSKNGAEPPADLVKGLLRSPKYLPCRFLYDACGSQLYEAIQALPEYYPFDTEQALLRHHAAAIASQLPAGGVVVELGCGDCSKTAILLEALLARHGAAGVRFCGIDCSAEALRQTQRSLRRLVPGLPKAQVELVEDEYLAGIQAVRRRHPDAMLSMLWLGSSVGNFSDGEAAELLGALRAAAGERSQLLLCTDMWKEEGALLAAYNDPQGVSAEFIVNGMQHALGALGVPGARVPGLWRYEPVVNHELRQVEMWVRAARRVPDVLPGVHIEAGERVLVEISRKFTPEGVSALACPAGLVPAGGAWGSPAAYRMTLLLTPAAALQRAWADTDSLFAGIRDWAAQPIALRRPFAFYYGHVAAFAKLTLLPGEAVSELDAMLSRGIDPLVTDPSQCHSHPEAPPAWPDRRQLQAYAAGVRQQVLAAVRGGLRIDGPAKGSKNTGSAGSNGARAGGVSLRALCMAVEHERQHQETLCYMLAQQRKADAAAAAAGRPPVLGAAVDGGEGLPAAPADAVQPFYLQQCSYASASLAQALPVPDGTPNNSGVPAEPATPSGADSLAGRLAALRLGPQPSPQAAPASAADADAAGSLVHIPAGQVTLGVDPSTPHGFRWDVELGRLGPVAVPGLLVGAGPVTVAQFRRFVFEDQGYSRPELWDPTAFRHFAASGHSMPATWALQGRQLWVHMPEASYRWEQLADCPALAEAQAYCRLHGGRLLSEPEWELAVGSAAAAAGAVVQLEAGGWEWTATPLAPLPGFSADPLYPAYAADFFDGSHCVLRGASPYTHPGAARRSFRNWFQPMYPFVFAKFRLARSAEAEA